MRTPLPEALDKLSILTLKLDRLGNHPNRSAVEREHAFYVAVVDLYRKDDFEVKDTWLRTLMEINARIWDIEALIRQEREGEITLEEIGRRALQIRNINRERVEYKNKIAEELGIDFFEVKVNHASGQ